MTSSLAIATAALESVRRYQPSRVEDLASVIVEWWTSPPGSTRFVNVAAYTAAGFTRVEAP